MEGAKSITDTVDFRKKCGRQAFYLGRSVSGKMHGPSRNENPGGSRIIAA